MFNVTEDLSSAYLVENYQYFNKPFPLANKELVEDKARAMYEYVSPGFDFLSRVITIQILNGEMLKYNLNIAYRNEERARSIPLMPTIGAEIEIPYPEKMGGSSEFMSSALELCKLGSSYLSAPGYFEFSLPYSYSWSTQALLALGLLKGNYIPHFQKKDSGSLGDIVLVDQDKYSMHINLGIPDWLAEGMNKSNFEKGVQAKARRLAVMSGLAFSSKNRLLNRKTATAFTTNREASGTEKNKERGSNGRFEYRALGFGTRESFWQFFVLQYVSVPMFASIIAESGIFPLTKIEQRLVNVWRSLDFNWGKVTNDTVFAHDFYSKMDHSTQEVRRGFINQIFSQARAPLQAAFREASLDAYRIIHGLG